MIGSWRAASPRGGACNTSARRSSMPAPFAAAAALAALAVDAAPAALAPVAAPAADAEAEGLVAWLDGAGCASAATVKAASGVASQVAPSRGRSRTLDRGSWRAAGLTGREAGGCEARGRLSRAGRRTETVPRPAADATPICRIDYPRGVPLPRACPPPDSPRDPAFPACSGHRLDRPRARRRVLRVARPRRHAARRPLRDACGRRRATPAFAATSAPIARRAAASSSWMRRHRRKTSGHSSTSPA